MVSRYTLHETYRIDSEHAVQKQLLHDLKLAMAEGRETVELHDQLADYSRAHFQIEELFMEEFAYPEVDVHVGDHEKLMNILEAIELPAQLDHYSNLLLRHIIERDAQLLDFLGKFDPRR